jgi:hypothetical protein
MTGEALKRIAECAFGCVPERACEVSNRRFLLSQRTLSQPHPPLRQVGQRCNPGGLLEAYRERRPRHRHSLGKLFEMPGAPWIAVHQAERLKPYLALIGVVPWRLFWLTHINRQTPSAPCTIILAEHEWKALYTTIYRSPTRRAVAPSVHQAVRSLAQLGGFF